MDGSVCSWWPTGPPPSLSPGPGHRSHRCPSLSQPSRLPWPDVLYVYPMRRISVIISLLNLFGLFVFSHQKSQWMYSAWGPRWTQPLSLSSDKNMDPGQSEQSTLALAEHSCCYDYYFACWGRKAVNEFTPYALIMSAVCESRKNTGRNDTVSDVWTPSHCSSSEKYISPIQNLKKPMIL